MEKCGESHLGRGVGGNWNWEEELFRVLENLLGDKLTSGDVTTKDGKRFEL